METTELERRLARCERSLRRLRFVAAGAGMCALALFAAGARTDATTDLRARSVTVVDEAGHSLVELGVESGAGHLRLRGPGGAPAAELLVTAAGGRAVVYDARGRVAVVSGSDGNGGTFSLANKASALVVTAKADESGHGLIGTWTGRDGVGRLLGPDGVKKPVKENEED